MSILPHQTKMMATLMDEAAGNLRLVMDTTEAEQGKFRHYLPDELEGSAIMLRDSLAITASKRVEAVALLAQWSREQVGKGKKVNEVYNTLEQTLYNYRQAFMTEHELPGCRYWLHPESDSYFATAPGETIGDDYDASLCIELTRYEFLGRQDLHFGFLGTGL